MLSDEDKPKLTNRLRRIAGQVAAIERMIEEDSYCVEILMQISAVTGAIGRVDIGTMTAAHFSAIQELHQPTVVGGNLV